MHLKIIRADIVLFKRFKKQILDIYYNSLMNGPMEQYLDMKKEEQDMLDMLEGGGFCLIAFEGDKIIGFLLATPLVNDVLLPQAIKEEYPVEKCFYVAEIHMNGKYRGKGIGTKLMETIFTELDREKNEYLFVRSWMNNSKAHDFYRRFGFKDSEIIEQEKIKSDRSAAFTIQKKYFVMKLT